MIIEIIPAMVVKLLETLNHFQEFDTVPVSPSGVGVP